MRPGMAVTDACGESVHCIRNFTPHDSGHPPVQLRHDQSPGISCIFPLSTRDKHSLSDLESVGSEIDSAHP